MNRFFSKLDLRDIKISPEGSRFPPDADEQEPEVEEELEAVAEAGPMEIAHEETVEIEYRSVTTTTWDAPADEIEEPAFVASPFANGNGHLEEDALIGVTAAPALVIDPEYAGVVGEVLKVSARSRPSAVAGAIAGVVRESGRAEVQAIGAGATNQAVKAVAIARDYLRETGIDAVCLPAFIDVTIENEDRTAIRLVVEAR